MAQFYMSGSTTPERCRFIPLHFRVHAIHMLPSSTHFLTQKRKAISTKMAAHSISTPTTRPTRISQPECNPLASTRKCLRPNNLHSQWLGSIAKLSIDTSSLRPFIPKQPPVKATITFSLPTANPERVASAEKVPKWSSKAIKSFAMGELEARKLKYSSTGTEALIMGILIEGTNFASKFLRANGITLMKVREESVKLLGKAELFYFSPEHPPLTEDAQKALDWAFHEKLKSGADGEITPTHLLLGVWSQKESPGHKILAGLGLNNEKVQELVSSISEPGFAED